MIALSSAEIPSGIPARPAMKIYKKRKCAGDDGKKEKARTPFLSPSPLELPWPVAQGGICGSRGMVATLSLSAVRYLTCTSI